MIETLRTMNTTLGTGDVQLSEGFLAWRKWVRENPDLGAGRLLHLTCPHLSDQECAAYDAPLSRRPIQGRCTPLSGNGAR
jgi:hypothetical protein